jgi:prophage DNA circulation protein
VQTGILFALSAQCKIIALTTFVSRDDIEDIQSKMKASFDLAKEMAADDMDNIVYQQLVNLAAKLARYLADTALPLPRVVIYQLRPMPVLLTSYRIYSDASRSEEIMSDNKVVHPAFVRSTVRALST